ncbi:MAG TPA: hypothetical protein VLN48_08530 [Bryobacteraceae bacterium]|nr:hypothetical protein [Bryobacteraceae bacterium]
MKAAGANLTDEQVPVVAEFLTRAASTLTVADAGGGGKGGGKGKGVGGGGGKNIQVLHGADLPATMQSFVQALGLLDKGTCAYCHVDDRSSDAKVQKTTAPPDDHHDACHQWHLRGRQTARDLLYLPPRQHDSIIGAAVLIRRTGATAPRVAIAANSEKGVRSFRMGVI